MRSHLIIAAFAIALVTATTGCADREPAAPATVTVPVEAPPAESEPVDAPAPATKLKVPNVKGKNLQMAVDRMERQGFTNILPLPVDGHAFVANYANWVIVGQDPTVGKRVNPDDEVTLEVKKTDEAENSNCLDGDC